MSPQLESVYIVEGKRSPFGKFGGSFIDCSFLDLLQPITELMLKNISINAELIDQVIIGNVLPISSESLYTARHLGLKIGMNNSFQALMLNRLCGSGFEAIIQAYKNIKLDEAHAILVGGVENLSACPHLIKGLRFGTKFGPTKMNDFLLETLSDSLYQCSMGETAEKLADDLKISREESDDFSFDSHQKAKRAYDALLMQNQLSPITIKNKTISIDEHLRTDIKKEELKKLKSTFRENGRVTAASASGVVDGAAVAFIASEKFVKQHHLNPIAKIISYHTVGVEPIRMGMGPVRAINELLKKNNLSVDQIDLFEINEAFAAQALYCKKSLSIPDEKFNIWGGAVAIGHPLAASGIRLVTTLAHQLKTLKKSKGIASACIGGGQGVALLIENL